jgi:diguanylate cyclase (GGDEF)-like protein/PAS domain S-box-containing protein
MSVSDIERNPALEDLEKYRRIFYATPDYATFSNLETGTFIDVNPGFEKLIGYSREEVIGRTAASIGLWVSEADRDAVVEALRHQEKIFFTTHFRKRNRETVLVELSAATFKMQDEVLLVAVVRDITERHQAEQELIQYRSHLEQLVAQRTAELEQAMRRLQELTVHDELTGVGNRRDLNNKLKADREFFDRSNLPFCVAVLDLDGLKAVNDQFGHPIGDQVIKTFADLIEKEKRAMDYLARYGGDEFVMLLRNVGVDTAIGPLQRICDAVTEYDWSKITPGIKMSASVGVAGIRRGESADALFSRADAALYDAKLSGRNRVVIAKD